ncbi:MAG: hypothetical protein WBE85_05585, partial [Methylocella sp.]
MPEWEKVPFAYPAAVRETSVSLRRAVLACRRLTGRTRSVAPIRPVEKGEVDPAGGTAGGGFLVGSPAVP